MVTKAEREENARADLKSFYQLKREIEELEDRKEQVQAELIDLMKKLKYESLSEEYEGGRLKGTLVEAERVVVDEQRLKKTLGARTFNKYTVRVLDKDKLEHGIASGEIDKRDVARCTEIKPNKPYVRVTYKAPAKR